VSAYRSPFTTVPTLVALSACHRLHDMQLKQVVVAYDPLRDGFYSDAIKQTHELHAIIVGVYDRYASDEAITSDCQAVRHFYQQAARKASVWYYLGAFVFIMLALFLMGTPVRADTTVGLHAVTWHPNNGDQHFNNINPGVYVKTAEGWTAGIYRNSVRRTTAYAGYSWETDDTRLFTAGLSIVAASGYGEYKVMEDNEERSIHTRALVPMLVPSISMRIKDQARMRITAVPIFQKTYDSIKGQGIALHLSFEGKF
jgi:hypothetical protein